MPTEQEIRAEIRRKIEESSQTEYQKALVDGKVRVALELRDLIQSKTIDRERKEILVAGGLYKPSLPERLRWLLHDRINLVRDRFHFLK